MLQSTAAVTQCVSNIKDSKLAYCCGPARLAYLTTVLWLPSFILLKAISVFILTVSLCFVQFSRLWHLKDLNTADLKHQYN